MSAHVGRNRYSLVIDIDLTHPLDSKHARPAAELLAADVERYLKENEWGYGRVRIEAVYAPTSQWEHGDFYPPEACDA